LVEVREDNAYANLVWPAILDHRGISDRDAAFATELGYGTLRWLARHDAILSACVDRGLSELDPALLDALRLGVHQLHNMRVPTHAAVSETVTLVHEVVNPGAARMANAVLRRVASGGSATDWLASLATSGAIPAGPTAPGYLAVAWSHPQWVVEALAQALSGAAEPVVQPGVPNGSAVLESELTQLMRADNEPARITLCARSMDRDELVASLLGSGIVAEPGALSRLSVRVGAANPAHIPEVATGRAGVQDEGSQLVALALGEAPLSGTDIRWLDMCAGPGGKAAVLAGLAAQRGGRLTAIELHEHRAQLVRNALRPVRGTHDVLCADALTASLGDSFDRVLVDAPCTGLGALRRRPESRWRRSAGDLQELIPLQRALLQRALEVVRPGGLVLYATCSPHLAETVGVVDWVMGQQQQQVELLPVPSPAVVRDGQFLRTWPHRHDTDGMFAALLRRNY
jgi:16S rRNA (cytosine967-C5)-methyltransferase